MKNQKLLKFCEKHYTPLTNILTHGIPFGCFTLGFGMLVVAVCVFEDRHEKLNDEQMTERLSLLITDDEKEFVREAACRRQGRLRAKDLDPLFLHVRAAAAQADFETLQGAVGTCV